MRRVARAGLCALMATCALAGTPATGAAAEPRPLPPQGLYDWCAPARSADGCVGRLNRIGQAGFRVVMNGTVFNDVTEARIRTYAQNAANAGVSVIWPLNAFPFQDADPNGSNLLSAYPSLASRCNCSTNQGLLAYLVGVLRGLPNTWGYYLADEPQSTAHAGLVDWVARIKALDPDHPRIILGCGVCDDDLRWLSDLDATLGTDAYPVIGGSPDPEYNYASVSRTVAALDRAAGDRQRIVALQSWRWGDSLQDSRAIGVDPASTRFPIRDEIQAQRDAALDYGHPDLILWFTLTDVIGWESGQNLSGWSNPSDPDQRWATLLGGAFAPVPPPRARASATVATKADAAAGASSGADAPAATSNLPPRARLTVRRVPRRPKANRFVADAGLSRDPDGRIVRYSWVLNGRRLARCRFRKCAFSAGRARIQRLQLAITDNRGAGAAVQRTFRTAERRAA